MLRGSVLQVCVSDVEPCRDRCCTKCICSCGCADIVVPTCLWCINSGCVRVQCEYRDVYMVGAVL